MMRANCPFLVEFTSSGLYIPGIHSASWDLQFIPNQASLGFLTSNTVDAGAKP